MLKRFNVQKITVKKYICFKIKKYLITCKLATILKIVFYLENFSQNSNNDPKTQAETP